MKFHHHRVIPFGFKTGKLKTLVISSKLNIVFGSIYSIQGTEKNLFTFTVDRGLR